MAEGSLPSPTAKPLKPNSSLFSSPRFFTAFSVKSLSESDSVMSPTSTLDNKPFASSRLSPEPCLDCKSRTVVGLGIVDALANEETDQKLSNPNSRMVLFGSQLKIQIPSLPSSVLSPSESPKFPSDFSIKTRVSQLGSSKSPCGSVNSSLSGSPRIFTSEMGLSEDYTCVIARGPNPRTTHIFEDCIVEDCCGFSSFKKENCFYADRLSYPSESFLSFCYNCKKNLVQGKDIYMYRGEKAFCSRECRQREILFDEEGIEKTEMDDCFSTCS